MCPYAENGVNHASLACDDRPPTKCLRSTTVAEASPSCKTRCNLVKHNAHLKDGWVAAVVLVRASNLERVVSLKGHKPVVPVSAKSTIPAPMQGGITVDLHGKKHVPGRKLQRHDQHYQQPSTESFHCSQVTLQPICRKHETHLVMPGIMVPGMLVISDHDSNRKPENT